MKDLVVERVPELSCTRPESDFFGATRTRLFLVGYVPDPTQTRLYETKHKIWSKKCMILPDKIPNFLGTRIRLFGIPARPESDFLLSDLFDTRLFTTRSTTSKDYIVIFYTKNLTRKVTLRIFFIGINWNKWGKNNQKLVLS